MTSYRQLGWFLFVVVLLLSSLRPVGAHPFRGSAKWSVLLCQFTDSLAPPRTVAFYQDLFVNRGTSGLADYYFDVSRGSVRMNASDVRGWFRIPKTIAQTKVFSHGGPGGNRAMSMQDCIDAATAGGYTVPAGNLVAVVTNPGVDLFGWPGWGAYLGVEGDLGAFGHEVSHGFGYEHSFADRPDPASSAPFSFGEYGDPFDIMSWANTFGTAPGRFGSTGPNFNAYHLDRMGWLARGEVVNFGANGNSSTTYTLTPLYAPGQGGTRAVRVPFDPSDMYRYYSIELRQPTRWDAGILSPKVLIHEVKRRPGSAVGSTPLSFLLRDATWGAHVQTVSANGVTITVNSIAADGSSATVTVTGNIAQRCLQGYVWREAQPGDIVCVTGAVRAQAWADNAAAASRRSPTGGAYGPDTCISGYVWREAYPGDHVCVRGDVRSQARADNAAAAGRINPARVLYGPNTCKQSYVWREADLFDYVCVTGEVRAETRSENSLANQRRSPTGGAYGPNTCLQGFVWREAFPDDFVCVPPASRSRAKADNAAATSKLQLW
jgi:hypothetical protein